MSVMRHLKVYHKVSSTEAKALCQKSKTGSLVYVTFLVIFATIRDGFTLLARGMLNFLAAIPPL